MKNNDLFSENLLRSKMINRLIEKNTDEPDEYDKLASVYFRLRPYLRAVAAYMDGSFGIIPTHHLVFEAHRDSLVRGDGECPNGYERTATRDKEFPGDPQGYRLFYIILWLPLIEFDEFHFIPTFHQFLDAFYPSLGAIVYPRREFERNTKLGQSAARTYLKNKGIYYEEN